MTRKLACVLLLSLTTMVRGGTSLAGELGKSLVFFAPFESEKAEIAQGDRQIYTAETLERKKLGPGLPSVASISPDGRWGNCLRFRDVSKQVVLFRGAKNVPFNDTDLSMSISFWLRVDPEKGLKPGYVDPLQITAKKWNDSSLFVDFTKDDKPRHFRLGVFSDLKHWNPAGKKWDAIPDADRPLVVEPSAPFSGERWTQVTLTMTSLNTGQPNGVACMYLDGQLTGCMERDIRISWGTGQVAIMLGIQYTGDIDDFAIFDRALTDAEVRTLYNSKLGIESIR